MVEDKISCDRSSKNSQVRPTEIKGEESANVLLSIRQGNAKDPEYTHPVSVPSGTPVTNVGLNVNLKTSIKSERQKESSHHSQRFPIRT